MKDMEMGFSLQSFFDQLLSIIENKEEDIPDRYDQLKDAVQRGHQYAKECGMVKR